MTASHDQSSRDQQRRSPIPSEIEFRGRILFLTEDPDLLESQLQGHDLDWSPDIKLRDDISTDEITPVHTMYHYDQRLSAYPYVGLRSGGRLVVSPDSVRLGNFSVCVSGARRGKGSSREHAPFAELSAGIRLVIAESFGGIYRENCLNLGLLTSTDFGLIARIRRGERIPTSEFAKNADNITRQIVQSGGLFDFNKARLSGEIRVSHSQTQARPMTLSEKIIANHFVVGGGPPGDPQRVGAQAVKPGDVGFVRADFRVSHEYITPMAATLFKTYCGSDARVADPGSVLLFRDHLTFLDEAMTPERKKLGLLDAAVELKTAQEVFAREQGIRLHGELKDRKGSEAINHNGMLEMYSEPGQFIVSADSHAPHMGALGCLAVGVGSTAMANLWLSPDLRVAVPESVRVSFHGRRAGNVTAKDFMLCLLRHEHVKRGDLAGRVIEYAGAAVEALGVDERATLTNMAAEIGAFSALVSPDSATVDYLVERRGIEPHRAEALCRGIFADPDAQYAHTLELDVSDLMPMVALPGDPSNGVFVSEIGDVPIDIAFGGSCTASKASDMDMYAEVFRAALGEGRTVHPSVQCIIQAGSAQVGEYCRSRGYTEIFERAGVRFIGPGCGACCNAGPGVSRSAEQVTISSVNRNYPGRSGPGKVYLASPYTVAASAVAGKIVAFS